MQEAGKAFDLATICEVVSLEAIEAAVKYVDMIQIGAHQYAEFHLIKRSRTFRSSGFIKAGSVRRLTNGSMPQNILWRKAT